MLFPNRPFLLSGCPRFLPLLGCLVIGPLSSLACRKRPPPPIDDAEAVASAMASSSASLELGLGIAPQKTRCKEVERGAVYTVGEAGATPTDDEDQPSLPFSVELGTAGSWRGGFVVGGLRGKDGGTAAFLALVGVDGGSGRLVDLGVTHGNAGAPRVAARDGAILAVVPDTDAGGQRLRIAKIDDPAGRAAVTWGAEVSEGRDDSAEFDIALGEKAAVLAWDEWDPAGKRGVLRMASFSVAQVTKLEPPHTLSVPKTDLEGPQLTARPGGFWLSYIAHEAEKGPEGAAKPSKDDDEDLGGSVLELGKRQLQVVPLDDSGAPVGEPISVSGGQMHVMVFDSLVLPDGALLVAWRSDDTSPGVEGGSAYLSRVGRDGSLVRHIIEGTEQGAGVPSLVGEPLGLQLGAKSVEWSGWLSLAGAADRTTFGGISKEGRCIEAVQPDPSVRNSELLALREGRLLLARPQGLSMELSVVRCHPELTVAGPPPGSSGSQIPTGAAPVGPGPSGRP